MTVLRSGSATDVGRVRTTNQDLALESANLFAVADGMGGHAGGEIAARLAVTALQETFSHRPTSEGLVDAVSSANAAVWNEGQEQADLRGMGTTLTAAALVPGPGGQGDVVALANVGDSRAYVYGDGELTQVTSDHSLAEERVRQGAMTEEEAAVHPHRHILTRALGIGPGVDVDQWELHLRTGDRMLLCSDGLTNEVSNSDIAGLLGQTLDPGEVADRLVAMANERGGNDNITVVVIDVMVGEEASDASPLGARAQDSGALGAAAGAALGLEAGGPEEASAPGLPSSGGSADARRGGASDPQETTMVTATGAEGAATGSTRFQGRPTSTAVADRPTSGAAVAAPEVRPTARRPEEGRGRKGLRRRGHPRAITIRVVAFVMLFAAVLVGAYFLVRWYAMDSYYVTIDHSELVIYQGHPGGVLWFQPRVADRTGVSAAQIPSADVAKVRANVSEPTLVSAQRYVHNLRQQAIAQGQIASGTGPFAGPSPPTAPASTSLPPTIPPPTSASTTTSTAPPGTSVTP